MLIGIPKEILLEERRIPATPETVEMYTKMGFEVMVESSAGNAIYRTDEEYQNVGAHIISDTKQLFAKSDVILKVKQALIKKSSENTKWT